MTKKHFIEIAKILREEREDYALETDDPDSPGWNPIDGVATRLASCFEGINPSFDRARFLAACGTKEE